MADNKKLIMHYYTDDEKFLCSKCAIKIFKSNKVIPDNVLFNTGKICVRCNSRIK